MALARSARAAIALAGMWLSACEPDVVGGPAPAAPRSEDPLSACVDGATPLETCQAAEDGLAADCHSGSGVACEDLRLVDAWASKRVCTEHGVGACRARCEAGSAAACYELGTILLSGERAGRDSSQAIALFERACAAGERQACRAHAAATALACSDDGQCRRGTGEMVGRDVAAAHFRSACGADARGRGEAECASAYVACGRLRHVADSEDEARWAEEQQVGAMRCLCEGRAEEGKYCGLLHDRGIAP